ncbi:hypothetical protein [Streptomyces sp. NPDC002788]
MDRKRFRRVAFAVAVAVICGLTAAFWRLARTNVVDDAVMLGGGVFVAAFTVTFMAVTYVHPE